MKPSLPAAWPKRPKGFYDDWAVFCTHALSQIIQATDDGDDELAVVLLAAGAVLGGAGLGALVMGNKDAIDSKGKEWGVANLSTLAGVGSAVLGATMGTIGMALLTRTLSRHADSAKVDAFQTRLSKARREFDALRADKINGRLDATHHQLAVERLFLGLAGSAA